jgi:hypothetical protein
MRTREPLEAHSAKSNAPHPDELAPHAHQSWARAALGRAEGWGNRPVVRECL